MVESYRREGYTMDTTRDASKILNYLYKHGETEVHELFHLALKNKKLKKDPYLFEELEQLETQGLIHILKSPSKSSGDFLEMIRITAPGEIFVENGRRYNRVYYFNEIRAWITAVVAIVGLIISIIALKG
jgi:hypothetical protein